VSSALRNTVEKAATTLSWSSNLSPMAGHLCQTCQSILAHGGCIGPHHLSIADLKRAVEERCHICTWIDKALKSQNLLLIQESYDGDSEAPLFQWMVSMESLAGGKIGHAVLNLRMQSGTHRVRVPIIFYSREAFPWPFHSVEYEIPPSTGDRDVSQLVNSWMRRCREGHSSCKRLPGLDQYP
jgi:hypothetical protein